MTFKAEDMVLPPEINKQAWVNWCLDRKERRMPLTRRAAVLSMNKLLPHSYEYQAAMVEQAIDFGYRGLFPVKSSAVLIKRGFIETHTDSTWAADL